jgi:2-keto-3-deoxy-L-rhamnonate aldolase RhmA
MPNVAESPSRSSGYGVTSIRFCVRVACRHGEPRDLATELDHVAAFHGPDDVVAGAARCVAAREGVVTEAGAEEVVPASAKESVVIRAAGQAI